MVSSSGGSPVAGADEAGKAAHWTQWPRLQSPPSSWAAWASVATGWQSGTALGNEDWLVASDRP